MHNTIPSSMYLFNHGLHGFGDWESLPLIGAIGIKKKICTVFCEHSHFLSPLCCVCIYKLKKIWLSRCYWVLFCCYLTIRLPFIEVLSSLTKAFLNLLHADRPYTYIAKYIKPVMYVCCSVLPSLCIQKKMSSSLKFKLNAYLLYFNIR